MKIIHVITRFNIGGTATWLRNLVKGSEKFGSESFIIAGNTSEFERENPNFLECNGIRARTLSQKFNPFLDLLAFLQIRKIIKYLKPDVVNTHTFKAGIIGRLAVLSLGSKRPAVVHTVHGHLLYGYFPNLVVGVVVVIEKFLASISQLVLFSGKRVMSECQEAGISSSSNSRLVNPGVEYQLENPFKGTLKTEQRKKCVGWLGRFVEVKDPKLALEVAMNLPEVEFVFGGDGPLLKELQAIAPSNCKFLGWVNEDSFWSLCDLALLTSRNEAQPYSILEALIRGIPVIATDAGSVSDVVRPNISGVLCLSDPIQIADEIKRIINDQSLYDHLSRGGADLVKNEYSIENQAKRHNSLYLEAIKLRRGK